MYEKVCRFLSRPVIVDEKPTLTVPYRIMKRLTTTCKLFHDAVYGGETVVICGSFCFSHQHNAGIRFVTAPIALNFSYFSYFSTVRELQSITLTYTCGQQLSSQLFRCIDPFSHFGSQPGLFGTWSTTSPAPEIKTFASRCSNGAKTKVSKHQMKAMSVPLLLRTFRRQVRHLLRYGRSSYMFMALRYLSAIVRQQF